MNNIIISNTCIGWSVMKKLNDNNNYNNPFIGSIILNDNDYIKLINNLDKYIYMQPYLDNPKNDSLFAIQNNGIWYKHEEISIPYPVIFLGDIEIHYIHENNFNECLDKVNRRLIRFRELIEQNNYKIIILLSFSELLNDHQDIKLIINTYFNENKSNLNIIKYFIGPSKYNNNNNYINKLEWDNIELIRDSSHVYNFNNQPDTVNIAYKLINNL